MAHVHGRRIGRHLNRHQAEVVLVDFFDTLIDRRWPSAEVKRDAARRLADGTELHADEATVLKARRQAERATADARLAAGDDEDFSITEVATAMHATLGQSDLESFVLAMTNAELAAEAQAQRLRRPIVEALARDGRPVVLVSDFHLPRATFEEMLHAHGIIEMFDDVVVSCDRRRSKASGRLYDVVVDELGLTPGQVTMIGDNPISDVARPRERGIDALHVPRASIGRIRRLLP